MILENKNILIITIIGIITIVYITFYISETYKKEDNNDIIMDNISSKNIIKPYINLVNENSEKTNYMLLTRNLTENEKIEVLKMKQNGMIFFGYSRCIENFPYLEYTTDANTDAANTDAANTDVANTDVANTDATNTDVANTDATNTDATNTDANTDANTDVANTDAANTDAANTESTIDDMDFYIDLCIGWFHHFRSDKIKNMTKNMTNNKIPNLLISQTDYIDYKKYDYINNSGECTFDSNLEKEYDFIIIYQDIPNINPISEYIDILCKHHNLNGLVVKENNCIIKCYDDTTTICPSTCHQICINNFDLENEQNITKLLNYYKKCRFIILPELLETNQHILTLALTMNIPCLFNKHNIGGWKYITSETGLEFDNLNDFNDKLEELMINYSSYEPRIYMLEHYGKENELKKNQITNFIKTINPEIEVDDKLIMSI